MKKNIEPINEKGQAHGYWETYYTNGNPHFKGNAVNGQPHGYWESYYTNGNIHQKGQFNNGKPYGNWEVYDTQGILITEIYCT